MPIEPAPQLPPLRKFLGGTRQAECVLVAAAQHSAAFLVDTHSRVAPPTLTVLFLKDQNNVSLLQCDLIGLLGKVCLGDLHLGQF